MPLSTIIKKKCEQCGKIAVEKSTISFGESKLITLECGHVITETALSSVDYTKIISSDGRKLMPYQIKGLQAIENADANAILAWEQGLGKTIVACSLLKLHREELLPAVIVVKTSIKEQWRYEIIRWCGVNGFLTQVISSGKELAAPGFDIYVTTYDLLKNENCFALVSDNIKFVVIDECQTIKDHTSGRAKAVQRICKNVEHILPMSGTPIKNNAGEYFTILNLVKPRMFPQYSKFIENDCDSYNNGWGYKVGGLKNPAAFHEKTKDFIFRLTKAEALPDLPKLFRKFYHVELDRKLNKTYAKLLEELEETYYSDDTASQKSANQLAIMNKMRQITGISKAEQAVEFTTEFLENVEKEKIVIGVHHQAAHNLLTQKLDNILPSLGLNKTLNLTSSLSAESRHAMLKDFENLDNNRVLIGSTLAMGEGLNIQFCSNSILLERQWNPANEEQYEARFHRFGQTNSVNVTYMIASETIDEYFTELVEQKRGIVSSTLDNKELEWNQASLLNELTSILISKGKKAWKL